MADELLPMNGMEEGGAPPAPDQGEQQPPQQQNDGRERDEGGRFAPTKEPKGQPNQDAARRREAQERDHYKAEAEKLRGEQEKWNKRFADMDALLKGEQEQPKPDPLAELSGKVDKVLGTFEQQQQERQQAEVWNYVSSRVDADADRFMAQNPDFIEARDYYINSRLREYKTMGRTQEQAIAELQKEAQGLFYDSVNNNYSAAERVYGFAQDRGYQPNPQARPAPQQQPQMRQAVPSGGRSLGTGAGAGTNGLTAQSIANMEDDDYMRLRNTPEGRAAIKRAMGG